MTNNIIVYSSNNCAYCSRAKMLLDTLDLSYKEINIQIDLNERDIMLSRSNGRRTVPQIFINNQHIGGYDDLVKIVSNGEYKSLLNNE